ncbi:elongation factor P maturation arginine rhamnosyltransferase EarP [Pseudohongiella spirulinae]|uniref:Protein-arginine rhamnosyltransferase n=1 Tax=Pseudohongiella spirulinae TaxID=1249552 RepID=A0A0S2KEI3_9GAMM|nr:elongation factor P maturation arginine rhamnosyltransferase EarP [Pseudohongiella spirulinae]ALO46526.1 hypothetical protein PS2015_1879 [Pseudohongiella spirulinae]
MIFCQVIDNLGDIGVTWRLAQQLANEHHIHVDLFVDDWSAFSQFLGPWPDTPSALQHKNHFQYGRITVHRWLQIWPDDQTFNRELAASSVIIEMFSCPLPQALLQAMAESGNAPHWLTIEYLSAESWVGGLHRLPSPQTIMTTKGSRTLQKKFFMPGFSTDSGGLLREPDVLQKHRQWQQQQTELRQELLTQTGLNNCFPSSDIASWVSLFMYPGICCENLLRAMKNDKDPVLCLIPEGKTADQLMLLAGQSGPAHAGKLIRWGKLAALIRPFVSQPDYDQMLSICDINIVRGEDSMVRAQWAAKPMLWHIYPQDDGAHINKLQAFIERYCDSAVDQAALDYWQELQLKWNLGDDIGNLWHDLRPHLPALQIHARNWQQKLAVLPDLTSSLVHTTGFAK